jgi:hypothetical protein
MDDGHTVGNRGQLSPEPALQVGVGGFTSQSLRQLGFPAPPRDKKGDTRHTIREEFVDITPEEMARNVEAAKEDYGGAAQDGACRMQHIGRQREDVRE